jgi:hypothetical protein
MEGPSYSEGPGELLECTSRGLFRLVQARIDSFRSACSEILPFLLRIRLI